MSFAGVCLSVMTCLSVTMPIYAPPTCPPIADLRKVGFCSSNGSYHEWDCMNCPPGLGLSVECGKVYDKVIKVECQPCKKGTFSENNDFGQCKPCSRCQENEVQSGQCKADKDAIQCTGVCKTGYYKAHGSCKPCSWCCGDNKTNEYVHECRNLQKKCSFQDVKSCGPTTPAPTILSTSVSTTSTSTTEESSSTPTQTEMTEITASTKNNLSTKETLTDTGTRGSIDSTEDEKETSGDKGSDGIILPIVIVLLALVLLIVLVCILVYCFWKKNGTSSGCDSEQVSISTSTSGDFKSTGNSSSGDSEQVSRSNSTSSDEMHSSALLISGADEKKNSTIENIEMTCICSKDPDAYAKGTETVPFLTTSGDQEKLGGPAEGTITGRDFPPNTLENPSCSTNTPENHTESTIGQLSTGSDVSSLAVGGAVITFMDTHNIKNNGENTRQLTKEEKLDLPVTELPLEIYRKVCALLDPEDPFFCDYRMVAEKFGVSKEQTRALIKPPTDSLLIKHKPKVEVLMEILEGMKREDVMEVVEEWLSQC